KRLRSEAVLSAFLVPDGIVAHIKLSADLDDEKVKLSSTEGPGVRSARVQLTDLRDENCFACK
ncbi:hypothetical protein, partial [Deinococcus marmoris]|uniref:hypothetical protein n=1 Tax=Deinococcus marmoris TaxID=249408 RepID=UPI0039F061AE